MRPLLFAVATCLACTRATAQVTPSTPIVPLDSIREMPVAKSAMPSARGRTVTVHMGETPSRLRYITYVVDSQFVLLADSAASDPANRNPLGNLSVADIESVYAVKEKRTPDSWRTCPGVPVMLILTRSKRWRPRVAETRTPNERCPVAAPR